MIFRHPQGKKIVVTVLAMLSLLLAASSTRPMAIAVPGGTASRLIRLHVIANSDSPEDQALKGEVRDEILQNLEMAFRDITDIEVSKQYIVDHLGDIESIAQDKILSSGKDLKVRALFGRFPFPLKTYGFIALPPGEYEALRVVIGEGKGSNWWCVLFPPLCFVDITQGIPEDEAWIRLKGTLSPEELAAIQTIERPRGNDIQIRYKVVDLWHEAQGRIRHAFARAQDLTKK